MIIVSPAGSVLKLNSRSLAPRTILVTDGFATSVEDLAGQEKTESNKQVGRNCIFIIGNSTSY